MISGVPVCNFIRTADSRAIAGRDDLLNPIIGISQHPGKIYVQAALPVHLIAGVC